MKLSIKVKLSFFKTNYEKSNTGNTKQRERCKTKKENTYLQHSYCTNTIHLIQMNIGKLGTLHQ